MKLLCRITTYSPPPPNIAHIRRPWWTLQTSNTSSFRGIEQRPWRGRRQSRMLPPARISHIPMRTHRCMHACTYLCMCECIITHVLATVSPPMYYHLLLHTHDYDHDDGCHGARLLTTWAETNYEHVAPQNFATPEPLEFLYKPVCKQAPHTHLSMDSPGKWHDSRRPQ